MASFTIRRLHCSLTSKRYKIQAAQKNTELQRRNSREGALKKEENRNLEAIDGGTKPITKPNSIIIRKAVAQI